METFLFVILPLIVVGVLGFILLTTSSKEVSKPVPSKEIHSYTSKRLTKRGLVVGVSILALAYYLGSRKLQGRG